MNLSNNNNKKIYDLSIIIPSINNPIKIQKLISNINRQNIILNKKIEVIIILQKKSIFNNNFYDCKYLDEIKFLYQYQKSLSIAKNTGIKKSKGKLISFLDDDVQIDKKYINNIFLFFKKNKNANIVFGSIKIENKKKFYSRYMTTDSTKINYFNMKKCLASAMILQAKNTNNFFDRQFGLGSRFPSSEESDFVLYSLIYLKYKIFYEPNILIFHKNDEFLNKDSEKIKKKFFLYGVGAGALHAKYLKKKFLVLILFIYELIKSFIGITIGLITFKKTYLYKHYYLLNGKVKGFASYIRSL